MADVVDTIVAAELNELQLDSPPASPEQGVSTSHSIGFKSSVGRTVSAGISTLTAASVPTSISSGSNRSVSSATPTNKDGQTSSRSHRRGYMRPHWTSFAESAKQRDSVMSLGSIAQKQFYFARTGLLDGRGAQLAPRDKKQKAFSDGSDIDVSEPSSLPATNQSISSEGTERSELPPPTVSTFRVKSIEVQRPPDINILREQLLLHLGSSRNVLDKANTEEKESGAENGVPEEANDKSNANPNTNGWHLVQGMHILDTLTSAIRATREYTMHHPDSKDLYDTIRTEQSVRSDLYSALDVLKGLAIRDFENGLKPSERTRLTTWVDGVFELLSEERERVAIRQEAQLLRQRTWLELSRPNQDLSTVDDSAKIIAENARSTAAAFMNSFIDDTIDHLPEWTSDNAFFSTDEPSILPQSADYQPSVFLQKLASGSRLIHLHNTFVRHSDRRFGEIAKVFENADLPWRRAENLKFWIKGAEIRWGVKLQVDVGIIAAFNPADSQGQTNTVPVRSVVPEADLGRRRCPSTAWQGFGLAIMQWTEAVRAELFSPS